MSTKAKCIRAVCKTQPELVFRNKEWICPACKASYGNSNQTIHVTSGKCRNKFRQ